jgi:hypothetical protein
MYVLTVMGGWGIPSIERSRFLFLPGQWLASGRLQAWTGVVGGGGLGVGP